MKKITFIVFALIAGTGFAQKSATSEVNATIVSPIEISSVADLSFGSINASTGGNVRVANDGTRTFSNTDMEVSSTTVTAAEFNIVAAEDYSYSISIPATVLSLTGAPDMAVTFTHDREAIADRVGSGLDQVLNVGGLLTVGSGQNSGEYTGTVEVTVAYE